MSRVCEICGKNPHAGRSVSHSHRVSNRMFIPNIHSLYCIVDGERRKVKVCSKCLKAGKVVRG